MTKEDLEYFDKFGITVDIEYSIDKRLLYTKIRHYDFNFCYCISFTELEYRYDFNMWDRPKDMYPEDTVNFVSFIMDVFIKQCKKKNPYYHVLNDYKIYENVARMLVWKVLKFKTDNATDERIKFIKY